MGHPDKPGDDVFLKAGKRHHLGPLPSHRAEARCAPAMTSVDNSGAALVRVAG